MRKILKGAVRLVQLVVYRALTDVSDLMEENQTLRGLLRGVSGFIGDGAGGLLPKLGWDMTDFTNFVNRSETDTAWESFQIRKKAAANAGATLKRTADDDGNGHAKKARGPGEKDDGYSMLLPMNQTPPVPVYPSNPRSSNHENNGGIFSDLMRGPAGSPMFMQPSPASSNSPYGGASSSSVNNFTTPSFAGLPSMNITVEGGSMAPPPFPPTASGSATSQRTNDPPPDQVDDDADPKKNEALKLIQCVFTMNRSMVFLTDHFPVIIWKIINETPPIVCRLRFDPH